VTKIRRILFFVLLIVMQLSLFNVSLYCVSENPKQTCCCAKEEPVVQKAANLNISAKAPICILVNDKNSKDEILPGSTQQYPLNWIVHFYILKPENEINFVLFKDFFILPESIYLFYGQRSPPTFL